MTRSFNMPLNEWNEMFHEIYHTSQNCNFPTSQIMAHFFEVVSDLGRGITSRPFQKSTVDEFLPKSFAWYFSIVHKFAVRDLEGLVWEKYPFVCPYCIKNKCECGIDRPDINISELKKYVESNAALKPKNFDEWQNMFQRIYGERNSRLTPYELSVKIFEQFGPLNEASRIFQSFPTRPNYKNELADMFAWLNAVANYVSVLQSSDLSIAQLTFGKYPNKCGSCGKTPCLCSIAYSVGSRFSETGPYHTGSPHGSKSSSSPTDDWS